MEGLIRLVLYIGYWFLYHLQRQFFINRRLKDCHRNHVKRILRTQQSTNIAPPPHQFFVLDHVFFCGM